MNKTILSSFAISKLLKLVLKKMGIRTRFRSMVFIFALLALLVSGLVITFELISSKFLFTTTFTASLETQKLSIRVGTLNAIISDISGRKISLHQLDNAINSSDDDSLFDFTLETTTENGYIELDVLLVPSGRAFDLTSNGKGQELVIEVDEELGKKPLETRIVWSDLSEEDLALDNHQSLRQLGANTWSINAIKLRVEGAQMAKPQSNPIHLKNVLFENNFVNSNGPISTSAIISGHMEFYVAGNSIASFDLREGEFLRFADMNAQLTNMRLTERGVAFIIVGEADAVELGFLNSLRDVHPRLLSAILANQSINIIGSAVFGLLLAMLGIVGISESETREKIEDGQEVENVEKPLVKQPHKNMIETENVEDIQSDRENETQ